MRQYSCWLSVALVSLQLMQSEISANDKSELSTSNRRGLDAANHQICGPRCTQFVLERFGYSVDLIDLLLEMQWPDVAVGCDMETIKESLEIRGVHAEPLKAKPTATIRWNYPVIAHMESHDIGQHGHFVVLIPGDDGEMLSVWDGLSGSQPFSSHEFKRRSSGYFLLTSRTPIADATAAVVSRGTETFWLPCFLLVCASGGTLWYVLLNRQSASVG